VNTPFRTQIIRVHLLCFIFPEFRVLWTSLPDCSWKAIEHGDQSPGPRRVGPAGGGKLCASGCVCAGSIGPVNVGRFCVFPVSGVGTVKGGGRSIEGRAMCSVSEDSLGSAVSCWVVDRAFVFCWFCTQRKFHRLLGFGRGGWRRLALRCCFPYYVSYYSSK